MTPALAATAAAPAAMLPAMKRPRPPSMFRQKAKRIARGKAKGGPRASIGRVAIGPTKSAPAGKELVGFTSNIAGPLKWAKAILRLAGLPTDLRSRTHPDGTISMVLLDDSLLEKGTLEWRAARVVFYATRAVDSISSGNADDAAFCANLATEHFWRGWFDDAVAPLLRTGSKVQVGADRRADEIRQQHNTPRLIKRYLSLVADRPGEDKAPIIRQVAKEFGISFDAAKKRIQRYPTEQ